MYNPNTYQRPGGEGEPAVVPIDQEGSHFKSDAEQIVVPSAHVGGTNVSVQFDVKTTAGTFTCFSDPNPPEGVFRFAGLAQDGGTGDVSRNSGTPSIFVDGVEQVSPTRDSLHLAIATGSWVTVRIEDVDTSGWSGSGVILHLGGGAHDLNCEVRDIRIDATGDGTWDAETPTGNDDGFEFIRCPA